MMNEHNKIKMIKTINQSLIKLIDLSKTISNLLKISLLDANYNIKLNLVIMHYKRQLNLFITNKQKLFEQNNNKIFSTSNSSIYKNFKQNLKIFLEISIKNHMLIQNNIEIAQILFEKPKIKIENTNINYNKQGVISEKTNNIFYLFNRK
ncbi:hypothetical protein [Rickettsia endosymbiont of Cardiosporidium cionae]|uniref:hypothetical protein n=1 Tax=Rickettsia endosymbiont of Cardiosporidium cionae TaxID=2777155 RepID=UPI0018937FD0|nr:hypothetical protein [Rickettsia endosymbiont of Cardiosporidium cionae]KAF8818276.1 hypothetical protein IHI24_000735 [Rickettsia endosymbiont of Cardiosporidium cionae]